MASTKGEVVPMLSSILKHHSFLSCHPMCGSEKTGLDGAKPDLYSGKTVILTPHNQKSKEHIETLKQFWTRIGCRVLEMPPQEHDRCVAWVSHMPHLVIPALVHSIEKGRSESPRVFDVAGTGLRDISRLAGSNPELWRDIFMENKAALKMALSGVMKEIRQLEEVLSLDDNNCARKLETYLRNAQGIHRDQSLSKI
jgi:prephenate dehydrogenase